MDNEANEKDYERFIAHRRALLDIQKHNIATFDKAILTLSSGALALSLVFIDKIGGVGIAKYKLLLLSAWASYLISILSNLASYRSGWIDADRQIKLQDKYFENNGQNDHSENKGRCLTRIFNELSFLFFASGTVGLCLFAYLNIGG